MLLTTVTVAELSRFLADSLEGDVGAFILYGRHHVLAHPTLGKSPLLSRRDHPLPEVTEVGDAVLASIWSAATETSSAALVGISKSHVVNVNGTPYVFIYREISGYSDQPWLIGRYLPLAELEGEVRQLEFAAWVGLFAILGAAAAAWLIGYAVGKPI